MADLVLTMPDRDWLFAEFSTLRQQLTDQHQRLRADMNAGFDRLREELHDHADEDRLVADRVLTMETQRDGEAKRSIQRGAWAGIIGAAGLGAGWEVIKYWAHLK